MGTPVITTWQPAREPGGPYKDRVIVQEGVFTDDDAVEEFVKNYGDGSRKDAEDALGLKGGFEIRVTNAAGKTLGWMGFWYPEALPNYKPKEA